LTQPHLCLRYIKNNHCIENTQSLYLFYHIEKCQNLYRNAPRRGPPTLPLLILLTYLSSSTLFEPFFAASLVHLSETIANNVNKRRMRPTKRDKCQTNGRELRGRFHKDALHNASSKSEASTINGSKWKTTGIVTIEITIIEKTVRRSDIMPTTKTNIYTW